jgi:hypothetical protein
VGRDPAHDLDGDGRLEVVVAAPRQGSAGEIYLYDGGASGDTLDAERALENPIAGTVELQAYGAGDLDGDGFSELVARARYGDGSSTLVVFAGTESGPGAVSMVPIPGRVARVEVVGDVNGDGLADVLAGISDAVPFPRVGRGAAYLVLGAPDLATLSAIPLVDPDTGAGVGFGHAVSGGGDLDGDGFADLAVGSPASGIESDGMTGRVLLYRGGPGMPATTPARILDDPFLLIGGRFGENCHLANDLDGDGLADLVAGGETYMAAFYFRGDARGLDAITLTLQLQDPRGEMGALFGDEAAAIGDFDGDGLGDLAVAATVTPSRIFLYGGTPSGIATLAAGIDSPVATSLRFGWRVRPAGDVDADGYADIAVGTNDARSPGAA